MLISRVRWGEKREFLHVTDAQGRIDINSRKNGCNVSSWSAEIKYFVSVVGSAVDKRNRDLVSIWLDQKWFPAKAHAAGICCNSWDLLLVI